MPDHDRETLSRLVDALKELTEITRDLLESSLAGSDDLGVAAPVVDASWQSFVADHPELAPEPLQFTDDELVAALAEAEKQWTAHAAWHAGRGAHAHCVALVLRGFPILGPGVAKGDSIRIGRALARLGREGRLVQLSRSWESTKRWTAA